MLVYPDVRAVGLAQAGLGCSERVRIGEGHRAQLAFESAAVIVAEANGDRVAPSGGVATHSSCCASTMPTRCANVRGPTAHVC